MSNTILLELIDKEPLTVLLMIILCIIILSIIGIKFINIKK